MDSSTKDTTKHTKYLGKEIDKYLIQLTIHHLSVPVKWMCHLNQSLLVTCRVSPSVSCYLLQLPQNDLQHVLLGSLMNSMGHTKMDV